MANVTDEDNAEAAKLGCWGNGTLAVAFAECRERAEARTRKEMVDALAEKINSYLKRIADLEAQLAAAKPVLTAEEEYSLKLVSINYGNSDVQKLCVALRKYTTPYVAPKPPPTLDELADKLTDVLPMSWPIGDGARNAVVVLQSVIQDLRARGGK